MTAVDYGITVQAFAYLQSWAFSAVSNGSLSGSVSPQGDRSKQNPPERCDGDWTPVDPEAQKVLIVDRVIARLKIDQMARAVLRHCFNEGCPRCGDDATGSYWLQDVCRGCRHEIHLVGVSSVRNKHGGDRYIPGPHIVPPIPYLGELLSPEERLALLSPEIRERYIGHIKKPRLKKRGQ